MLKKRMNSFKKSMAILACVAFISVVLPEVTHAATRSSSTEFSSSKESFPLFSAFFSFASFNLSLTVYDLATLYSLSNNQGKLRPRPLPRPASNTSKKNSDDNNGIVKNHDNSTSKKPPKLKD